MKQVTSEMYLRLYNQIWEYVRIHREDPKACLQEACALGLICDTDENPKTYERFMNPVKPIIDKAIQIKNEAIETLLEKYIEHTGLSPAEIIMCQQNIVTEEGTYQMRIWFEEKK